MVAQMTETAATCEPLTWARRHVLLAALLAGTVMLAVAALLGACGSPQSRSVVDASGLPVHRPVLQSDLSGRPQARLYYPGSVVEKHVGSDQTSQAQAE